MEGLQALQLGPAQRQERELFSREGDDVDSELLFFHQSLVGVPCAPQVPTRSRTCSWYLAS